MLALEGWGRKGILGRGNSVSKHRESIREEQRPKLEEGKALNAGLRGLDCIWKPFMDGSRANDGLIRSELLGADTTCRRGPDPLLLSTPLGCPGGLQIPLPLVQLTLGWRFPVEMLTEKQRECESKV